VLSCQRSPCADTVEADAPFPTQNRVAIAASEDQRRKTPRANGIGQPKCSTSWSTATRRDSGQVSRGSRGKASGKPSCRSGSTRSNAFKPLLYCFLCSALDNSRPPASRPVLPTEASREGHARQAPIRPTPYGPSGGPKARTLKTAFCSGDDLGRLCSTPRPWRPLCCGWARADLKSFFAPASSRNILSCAQAGPLLCRRW